MPRLAVVKGSCGEVSLLCCGWLHETRAQIHWPSEYMGSSELYVLVAKHVCGDSMTAMGT